MGGGFFTKKYHLEVYNASLTVGILVNKYPISQDNKVQITICVKNFKSNGNEIFIET
jgi:hypothetical protein